MIMDWPVTSKPLAIAAENSKVRSNSKSLFRNYLQCLRQVKLSTCLCQVTHPQKFKRPLLMPCELLE